MLMCQVCVSLSCELLKVVRTCQALLLLIAVPPSPCDLWALRKHM